jgi:hypothetical protein
MYVSLATYLLEPAIRATCAYSLADICTHALTAAASYEAQLVHPACAKAPRIASKITIAQLPALASVVIVNVLLVVPVYVPENEYVIVPEGAV